MEPGLYVTFFTEGEPFEKELPPVGPLEHLVVRDRSLIAERREVRHADHFGGAQWIEAERELQRALGEEPGGARRPDLRVGAPEGVYLRFVSFGEAARDPLPELGPYAVVVIGERGVEADGDQLATRDALSSTRWKLTGAGGSAFVGIARGDIAFRTRSTAYHPHVPRFGVRPPPARTAPVHIPAAAPPAPKVARPPAPPVAASKPSRQEAPVAVATLPRPAAPETTTATLRGRIGAEPAPTVLRETRRSVRDPLEFAGALWRLRFVIIAVLVVLIGVFSVPALLSFFDGSRPTWSTVSVTTPVTAPEWTYAVGVTRRVTRLGQAQARGIYYVVQMGVTNRSKSGAQLQPGNFALATPNGQQYVAQSSASGVYSSDTNLDSPYLWPREFPVGRQVVVPLVFDVDPSIEGAQLVMLDVPGTRIRLE